MNPTFDYPTHSVDMLSDFAASMASMSLKTPRVADAVPEDHQYFSDSMLISRIDMLGESMIEYNSGDCVPDFAVEHPNATLMLGGSAKAPFTTTDAVYTESSRTCMLDHQFFLSAMESAIAAIPLPDKLIDSPRSSSSPADTSVSIEDIFDLDAFYASPRAAVPNLLGSSHVPSVSNRGSLPSSPTSSTFTTSDVSDAEEQPLVLYDADANSSPDFLPDCLPSTMSAVEESVLGRAFRAAQAVVAPELLAGNATNLHTSCDPHPSRKHHSYKQANQRKQVSSTSLSTRTLEIWPYGKPRNVQSPVDASHFDLDSMTDGILHCPVPQCNYVQWTGRRPDMKRHIETHRSGENQMRWVCCGVPVEQAAAYGIEDVSNAYWWRGWWMVGGCRRGFSRRDSLGRHINRESCSCKGHPDMASDLTRTSCEALGQETEDGEEECAS